jgi:hypothetical protein
MNVVSQFAFSPKARSVAAAIEAAVVWHPVIEQIRDFAVRLAMRKGEVRWPGGFIVSGPPGTGKDTVIEAIRAVLAPSPLLAGSSQPLLVVTVGAGPTDSSILSQLLGELFYVFAHAGTATTYERRKRLIKGLQHCNVRLILFNEFQHTVENNRLKLGKTISDFLKLVYEETRIPMGFFGTPVVERIESINDQFASRFATRFALRPFALDATFQGILKGFESEMSFFEPVGLWQKRYARPIHRACGGVMRLLKELLVETAIVAVERGATRLTLEDFAEGYRRRRGTAWGDSPSNPFESASAA